MHCLRKSDPSPCHFSSSLHLPDEFDDGRSSLSSEGSSSCITGPSSRDGDEGEENHLIFEASPLSESRFALKVHLLEKLLSAVFSSVSSLRQAYKKLQAAHTPYDPEKLQIADKAVIAELRKLTKLKQSYREERAALCSGCCSNDYLSPQQIYKEAIDHLQPEVQEKNASMENLKETLDKTIAIKEKLEQKMKRLEQSLPKDLLPKDAFPRLHRFESTAKETSGEIKRFTTLLVSFMRSANWDLDAASNSIEPGIHYGRHADRKYAFQSYICHRMFNGLGNPNFYTDGSVSSAVVSSENRHCEKSFTEFVEMTAIDPLEIVTACPASNFAKFCQQKYLELVHPKMEESFFGNLEHRNQVTQGGHPPTQFYQAFLNLAKAIWLLHKLSFSFDPFASIFLFSKGAAFSSLYMESVVATKEMEDSSLTVGFTVMPGFRVEKKILKCQVYVVPANKNNESYVSD